MLGLLPLHTPPVPPLAGSMYLSNRKLRKVVAVVVDALLALCPKASLGAGRSGAVDS